MFGVALTENMCCRLLMGQLLTDEELQAWAHGRFDMF